MLNIKVITCRVLAREFYAAAADSENRTDITVLKQGLHNEPQKLLARVKEEIARAENSGENFDAIVLGYGLCSNGTAGVGSSKFPVVLPRAHDCITLLLGSRERYNELFNAYHGGVYWYSRGWIEETLQPGKERYERTYEKYLEKYGEDNAEYLMQLEESWMSEYKCALYITGAGCNEKCAAYTKECAAYLNWEYRCEHGSPELIRRLVDGRWDDKDFIIIPPGSVSVQSYKDDIFTLAPAAPAQST